MSISNHSEHGAQHGSRLASLSRALDLDGDLVQHTYRALVAPWTQENRASAPSEAPEDSASIMHSVAIDPDAAALRILFEPRPHGATIDAARSTALLHHEALEGPYGADLRLLRRVEELFLPAPMQGRFAVFAEVAFARGERPRFRAYLNPQARGAALAPALVEEALERLGLRHAWANLSEVALRRGPVLDELTYFALDLTAQAPAQAEVYVQHHDATAADLAAACGGAQNADAEGVLSFARTLRGGDEPNGGRAPFTCHAFTAGGPERATASVFLPVGADAQDAAAVERRLGAYLDAARSIDPARFRRVVQAASTRPQAAATALPSWLGLRCSGDRPRLTVHLGSESRRASAPGGPAASSHPVAFPSPESVIAWLMERPVGAHPLLRRIARTSGSDTTTRHAAAARHLHEVFADLPQSSAPHEALGALVAGVAAVRLFDFVQPPFAPFDDLLAVARLVPCTPEASEAFGRGALHMHCMVWRAFDAAYVATFGAPPWVAPGGATS